MYTCVYIHVHAYIHVHVYVVIPANVNSIMRMQLNCYVQHFLCSEQLNKIDEDIKKLLYEKLKILQSMQGTTLGHRVGTEVKEDDEALRDPKEYVAVAIEQGAQNKAVS